MWYNNIRLKWKATDMKTTFSILCCAVATAVFALPPVRPVLPTVAHDDTETATNVSFAAWQDCAGKFNFSLTCRTTPTNNVQVSFGTDADGDGVAVDGSCRKALVGDAWNPLPVRAICGRWHLRWG